MRVSRILAVTTILLALLTLHQYSTIEQLRADEPGIQSIAAANARAAIVDALRSESGDVRHAIAWLDDFYRSPDGLRRPEGLCVNGRPDYDALRVWIVDVYMRERLNGTSDETALNAVRAGIERTPEWRAKHPHAQP